MANNVVKVNGIAIANIAKLNGITDANLVKLNGREFTGAPPDDHVLLATATGAYTRSFTTSIDSTYDVYEFRFENMHPVYNGVGFQFQVSDGQSGFNQVMTTTLWREYTSESGSASFGYLSTLDQAQTQLKQQISPGVTNGNDESTSGILTLYAPSSTAYVKHFVARTNVSSGTYCMGYHTAGYINTTSAITQIAFSFSTGTIQAGQIKMYGIAKA